MDCYVLFHRLRRFSQIRYNESLSLICENLRNLWICLTAIATKKGDRNITDRKIVCRKKASLEANCANLSVNNLPVDYLFHVFKKGNHERREIHEG
jgi:hypothetical protein